MDEGCRFLLGNPFLVVCLSISLRKLSIHTNETGKRHLDPQPVRLVCKRRPVNYSFSSRGMYPTFELYYELPFPSLGDNSSICSQVLRLPISPINKTLPKSKLHEFYPFVFEVLCEGRINSSNQFRHSSHATMNSGLSHDVVV